jgi:hypothetical protein
MPDRRSFTRVHDGGGEAAYQQMIADGCHSDSAIAEIEKRGQESLLASSHAPRNLLDPIADFELLGVKFGEALDDLFREVQLPPGWSKRISVPPYWIEIIDEHQRPRINVFYKAAFHDRRAEMTVIPRFEFREDKKEDGRISVYVFDRALNEVAQRAMPREHHEIRLSYAVLRASMTLNFPKWIHPAQSWQQAPAPCPSNSFVDADESGRGDPQ